MHEYVKEDLQKKLAREIDQIVPLLERDLEIRPINRHVIDLLKAKQAILDDVDRLEPLAISFDSEKPKVPIDLPDLCTIRGILTDIWVTYVISVFFDCYDDYMVCKLVGESNKLLGIE